MDRQQRKVALLVAGCFFMEMLDTTIVTTAVPQIGQSLGAAPTSVSLVITAYVVTVAALIPVSGWLAARIGARPVFLIAIAIFTLASVGCAASGSLAVLVAMRILQAIGGAMMVPVGRYVVLSGAAKGELMRAMSFLIWPALVAPLIAPLAGGLITSWIGWQWIFLINLPLGVIAFLFALKLIDRDSGGQEPPALDLAGAILTCAGLAMITFSAHLFAEPNVNWVLASILSAASVIVISAAVRHLLRAPNPLLNLRVLSIPTFGASIRDSFLFLIVIGAGPFIFPLLFQEAFGWSPIEAGAVVMFIFAGNIAIKPATTFIFSRFGFRKVLITTTAAMAAAMGASAFLTEATPTVLIALLLTVIGFSRSVGGTGYSTLAFSDISQEHMRDATVLQWTSFQLSLGLGVTLAAVALRVGDSADGAPAAELSTQPFAFAFAALAFVSLLATVGAIRLHAGAGDVLRSGRSQG